MEGGLVEQVKDLNKRLDSMLQLIAMDGEKQSPDWPTQVIEEGVVGFLDTAKQLEASFVRIQHQHSFGTDVGIKKEIKELEEEIKRKDELLEKYKIQISEWEKDWTKIQQSSDQS